MGNTESEYSVADIKYILEKDPNYLKIKSRSVRLGVNIIIQGDGSIQIQNTNNLVKGNMNISGPKKPEDIDNVLEKLSEAIQQQASDLGYNYFGYQ